MSNTCYIISPLFLFHWFNQVATKITFTSETSLILLLLKCFPLNTTKKPLVKIVEHKLEEAFSNGILDVQLGRFILLSVPISQQLPRLTSLYSFSLLNWPLKHDCSFRLQRSGGSEPLWKAENYSLASNKLQSTLHAIFTLDIYSLIFVASIKCPDSRTMTSKNTYCTTCWFCSSSRSG